MKKTAKIKNNAISAPNTGKPQAGAVTVINQPTPEGGSASRPITPDLIASRAYTLWEQAGRPPGRDVEYWLKAEAQLKQGS
jgi:hypothetical protein